MSEVALGEELSHALSEGLRSVGADLAALDGTVPVYGLVIYLSPDLNSLGVACSRVSALDARTAKVNSDYEAILEKLKHLPDVLARVRAETAPAGADVWAAEWESIGDFQDRLSGADSLLAAWHERVDPRRMLALIQEASQQACTALRASGVLDVNEFADDVFLGMQFSTITNVDAMVKVSEQVNSETWHARFLDYLRTENAL